jgi:hypothetical protein
MRSMVSAAGGAPAVMMRTPAGTSPRTSLGAPASEMSTEPMSSSTMEHVASRPLGAPAGHSGAYRWRAGLVLVTVEYAAPFIPFG